MRPYLFEIFGMGIPSFFFMVMIGALSATFYAAHVAKKSSADPVAILDFGIIAVIASVIGARIFHILVENPAYYLEDPVRVFYFWQGGFVSLGAFIASLACWMVYVKKRKLDSLRYLDIAVTGVPIIIFCVRVGCMLVGCCYGKPTDFPLHLTFTNPSSVPAYFELSGVHLHATQLYFMINAVVMFVLLNIIFKYQRFKGQTLAAFFIYYGITRFFIEFLRGDDDRGIWLGGTLSSGQIAMVFSFLAGVALWIYQSRKQKKID